MIDADLASPAEGAADAPRSCRWPLWIALGLAAVAVATRGAADPPPEHVLAEAFRRAYDLDRRGVVELVTRNRYGEVLEQRAELASKRIAGRLHTLVYFTAPEHVSGTRILTIENAGRSYDSFVYLPTLGAVRRITSAKRSQSFLGTDLTYEEFERQRVEDFTIEGAEPALADGESALRVRARPRRESEYDRVEFLVSRSDFALLESRYFKRDSVRPFRLLRAPRPSLQEIDGHLVPTRLLVETLESGTQTEVRLRRLEVNPQLDDRLFTVRSLEYGPPLRAVE